MSKIYGRGFLRDRLVVLCPILVHDRVHWVMLCMNNRNEVVKRIIEWLNVEALAYTLKENDSDRFRVRIELSQNLNIDIQSTRQRPDRVMLLTHTYLGPADQRAYPG